MKCNKCGFENNDNAKFCSWCGEKFEALEEKNEENKCNVCGSVNTKDAKFCSVCGSQLSPKVLNEENKCYICGNVNANDAKYCAVCGSQMSSKVTVEEPIFQQSNYSKVQSEDKFGTSSMVVGIVALATTVVCCMFPLGIFGGIASVIFGIISIKRQGTANGKALAGLICGAIAFVLGLIVTISFIATLNDPEFLRELQEILEQSGAYY